MSGHPRHCCFIYVIAQRRCLSFFFFFNDTATTEIYTLSLHDALPICDVLDHDDGVVHHEAGRDGQRHQGQVVEAVAERSEEHTSELQSRLHLVCRLLLEKKKKNRYMTVRSTCDMKRELERLVTLVCGA